MGDVPGCPLCGAILQPWFQKLGRDVFRCPSCRHITVPSGVAIGEDGLSIYESEQPIFERDGNLEYYLDDSNMLAARTKASFVRQFCPNRGRLLDIGASYGHFLATIAPTHEAYGLELNRNAVAWGTERFAVRALVGSIYEPPADLPSSFDAISCWDVIEHLERPQLALIKCRELLAKGGWLFLSTPDAGSVVARLMGRHWHYLDPVQHINLFSRQNLIGVLEGMGFTIRGCQYFRHHYRVSYVINRLSYLAQGTALVPLVQLLGLLAAPIKPTRVPVKLWDVMGIAAQL
jgi:SAM-dependent methyltransferase